MNNKVKPDHTTGQQPKDEATSSQRRAKVETDDATRDPHKQGKILVTKVLGNGQLITLGRDPSGRLGVFSAQKGQLGDLTGGFAFVDELRDERLRELLLDLAREAEDKENLPEQRRAKEEAAAQAVEMKQREHARQLRLLLQLLDDKLYEIAEGMIDDLPKGMWTTRSGRKIVFSQNYKPMLEIWPSRIRLANPFEWINEITDTEYFYDTTNYRVPIMKQLRRSRLRAILREWVQQEKKNNPTTE